MFNLELTLYISGVIIIYAIIRWIRSRPPQPDPWENLSRYHEHDDVIDVQVKVIKEKNETTNKLNKQIELNNK